jgi:hypothetical protein
MKRIGVLVAVCFILLIASSLFNVGFATANPIKLGEVPPDSDTNPPSITIISPENNGLYNSSISLSFNVNEGESKTALAKKINTVIYKSDWIADNVTVYSLDVTKMYPHIHTYSTSLNLNDIPEGIHTITVYAVETGTYNATGLLQYYTFTIQNSASTTFTVNILDSPTPLLPEFSSIAIQLSLITMAAVAGLLVYFKKRKH